MSGEGEWVRCVFDQAAALAPGSPERRALLDAARAERPDLCDEVEGMLRHHGRPGAMLDRPPVLAAGEAEGSTGELPPGARVGLFTIVSTIGAGGTSVVYEATDAATGRTVALKLIRAELTTGSMIERFERWGAGAGSGADAERSPTDGVARVLGAGSVRVGDTPRAFMVSERVFGTPLVHWASTRSARAKIALVAAVCESAGRMHQTGRAHGAIRPGHILVIEGTGATPAPVMIDAGLAAVLDSGGMAAAMGAGAPLATSAARNSQDAAGGAPADVYALGALLYELITGRRPRTPLAGPPPSRSDPSLRSGEIDPILLCALAPDPANRYCGAGEMAADLRRLLDKPPPPDPSVILRARRRRTWLAIALAVLATIAGAAVKWAIAPRTDPDAPAPEVHGPERSPGPPDAPP